VIGTNKKCGVETADALLEDLHAGRLHTPADASLAGVERLIADHRPEAVEYAHWVDIDAHERERGEATGRPRIKICSWEDLLAKR
jgi:ferredoxin--NADP+ reductase